MSIYEDVGMKRQIQHIAVFINFNKCSFEILRMAMLCINMLNGGSLIMK